ncbi:MAG: DUF3363 domain-containing protein [Pseudoxanthomonas sp.]
MRDGDEDRFRPRWAPPRDRALASTPRFISRVLRAASKAGRTVGRTLAPPRGHGSRLGRGHVASRFAGGHLAPQARRVIIKARLVVLKQAGARSTQKHLRYIERDGVTRDGGRGQLYGADTDLADGQAFEARGRHDRHQFRFIVSPDDANALGDLKPFIRSHMARMEQDLGTKLDWVAVDHWDTDNPHTHVVLRGKDETGHDLIIARDYISHGMRQRASELVTQWLGLRSEREIEQGLAREMKQERWTSLDAVLARQAIEGVIDLRHVPQTASQKNRRSRLLGRLDHLTKLGLAEKHKAGTWRVVPEAEQTLRAMGERGDIIRTMQRVLGSQKREYAVWDVSHDTLRLSGRVVGKGLSDELQETGYLIVDGGDGRTHFVKLGRNADLSQYPVGGHMRIQHENGRQTIRSVANTLEQKQILRGGIEK